MKKIITIILLFLLATGLSAGTVCADNNEDKKELVQNWCTNINSAQSIEEAEYISVQMKWKKAGYM